MGPGHYAAQGQTAAAPVRDLSVLDEARSKIEDASNDVHALAMELNDIADRAFGPPPPSGAEAGKPSPVPNGAVGQLGEQIQRLHDSIGFLRTRIARLTPLA